MGKVLKIKQEAKAAPQTIEQVVGAIAEIGVAQRERTRIEAEMNDELAAVRQRFEQMAAPYAEKIRDRSQGVQTWCEAHRAEITENGKTKTVAFPSGEVRWRKNPPKANIKNADQVIDLLKKWGLTDFIRTKEEVNKEAILAAPEAVKGIKGISISSGEDFVIVPFETKLEEVA